jgi:hypothetical protein
MRKSSNARYARENACSSHTGMERVDQRAKALSAEIVHDDSQRRDPISINPCESEGLARTLATNRAMAFAIASGAEARGVCQTRNDIDKLEYRTRPAMQEQERHQIFADTWHVQVVQIDAIDGRTELRERH